MLDLKSDFEQALAFEFDPSIFDEINALVEGVKEEGGFVPRQIDEITIRKMIIAQKFKKEDIERLKRLRDAVKAEWDKKILSAEKEIESMDAVIQHYIENQNKGKKLVLDVATISLRENKHKFDVIDEEELINYLRNQGVLESFLKEPKLDVTAAKNYLVQQLEAATSPVASADAEQMSMEQADPEEAKKAFLSTLPPELVYKPSSKSVSIRMNK